MTNQRENKKHIREFLRNHYTDERLTWLLEHARSGRLSFFSCCCFIGVATADHALLSRGFNDSDHYALAERLDGADDAERAYRDLFDVGHYCGVSPDTRDEIRRRVVIPIIKAEIRRRDRLVQQKQEQVGVESHA